MMPPSNVERERSFFSSLSTRQSPDSGIVWTGGLHCETASQVSRPSDGVTREIRDTRYKCSKGFEPSFFLSPL